MLPKTAAPRIVVLKANRLYGDMISRHIKDFWRKAEVEVFQKGFDALDSIQARVPDMFIAGVNVDDMDGLEHFEPFIDGKLPILIVTSQKDARTFSLLRSVRYDGIYDAREEGLENLYLAMQQAMRHHLYVSPSMMPHLTKPKGNILETLTEKEQMVLSTIGDGSDDQEVAERLSLSPFTINTYRKTIMGKLDLHHKGQMMLYALQQGYVQVTPRGVVHPGFQRRIRAITLAKSSVSEACE
jgi:DNA-binding NarL/FixJ family response regulator